jgi:hypothetical protein
MASQSSFPTTAPPLGELFHGRTPLTKSPDNLQDAILKAALAQATNSNAELEAQLAGLQEEANNLNIKVLKFSFDLTQSGFTKGALTEQVKDLERLVAEQEEQAQIRVRLHSCLAPQYVCIYFVAGEYVAEFPIGCL